MPDKNGKHETAIERMEREICLACSLPDCLPHAEACGLRKRPKAKPHRAKMDPPHNFLYYGRVESVRKLTERYGVSHHVISRWRKELGIEPETTWFFGKK